MRRRIAASIGFVAILGVIGCSSGNPYFRTRSKANVVVRPTAKVSRVAVMPFKGPTELIANSVSDTFIGELMQIEGLDVVERSQIEKFLSESELSLSGLSTGNAMKAGQLAGAEAIVVGTVSQYEMKAHRGKTYAEVSITARLIECDTGRVLWNGSHSTRARSYKTTLPAHSQRVIHEMMAGVYKKWRKVLNKR